MQQAHSVQSHEYDVGLFSLWTEEEVQSGCEKSYQVSCQIYSYLKTKSILISPNSNKFDYMLAFTRKSHSAVNEGFHVEYNEL